MGRRTGADVIWRPVLLGQGSFFFRGAQDVTYHTSVDGSLAGGIYELIQAPQGKDGSATDVMSSAKLKVQGEGMYVHNTM